MQEMRYLGAFFTPGLGMRPTCAKLQPRVWGAWAALQRQYKKLGCAQSVWLVLQLCAACVVPIASFGSELWGTVPMVGACRLARNKLATVHLTLLKVVAGLRRTTPTAIVYRELGEVPLQEVWLVSTASFWNRLRTATCFHCTLFVDAVRLALAGSQHWVAGIVCALYAVQYPFDIQAGALPQIDIPNLQHKLSVARDMQWQGLHDLPRLAPSQGARLCTYVRWFARLPCPGPASPDCLSVFVLSSACCASE